jgi:glycosyltransferase involved in cell wall biosynthesis
LPVFPHPIRLLRVITRLNIGGPSTHVMLANRGLTERGYECLVVHGSLHHGEASIEFDRFGEVGQLIHMPPLKRSIDPVADSRASVQLRSIVGRFRPDIIHTHLSKAGVLGRGVGLMYGNARLVHTYHGNMAASFFSPAASRMVVAVERWLGARSDALIALSQTQLLELERLRIGHSGNREVVELAIDLDPYRRARTSAARAQARRGVGLGQDAVVILFCGRLVPVKRVDWLLQALAPLLKADPRLLLVVAGDGPERDRLESLCEALGIKQQVRFQGWVAKTADWYAAADLVVIGSSWEGTPLAIIEAMASARATVSTDVGGVRDIVRDGQTGLVVGKDDAGAFRGAVHELVSDSSRRDCMGSNAAAASERFSSERLVDNLDQLYRRLLAGSAVLAT